MNRSTRPTYPIAIRIDESKDRKEQRKNTNETGQFEMIFKNFQRF